MATHSSTLAWKIPWVEEPGGLRSRGSMGSHRVGLTEVGLTMHRVTEATSQQQEQTHTKSVKGIKRYTSFSSQCFSMFNLS